MSGGMGDRGEGGKTHPLRTIGSKFVLKSDANSSFFGMLAY